MKIRVYVVEDHPVMQETLRDFLAFNPDIDLCGMASSAEEARDGIESARPSVVLLDLSLPGQSGLEFMEEIRLRWRLPCVILSGHGGGGYVTRALRGGASGFVLKGAPREIPEAIRKVMEGEIYLSRSLRYPFNADSGDSGA